MNQHKVFGSDGMELLFTNHSYDRMKRRKMSEEEIVEAIKYPERITKKHGKYFFKKQLDRGSIEICCEKTERHIKIVTIYWV